MFAALMPAILSIIGKVIPDPAQAQAARLKVLELQQQGQLAELQGAVSIIVAESSGNWLQRSWRPLVMLGFSGLIFARMFGYTAPNVSPAEYAELWGLMKLGMGGYVIGRSVEKTAKTIAPAVHAAVARRFGSPGIGDGG